MTRTFLFLSCFSSFFTLTISVSLALSQIQYVLIRLRQRSSTVFVIYGSVRERVGLCVGVRVHL